MRNVGTPAKVGVPSTFRHGRTSLCKELFF